MSAPGPVDDACVLTTKDFTILEVMLDRCTDKDSAWGLLLRRKLDSATVVFREDVPCAVATLSSRVTYRIDAGEADTRILSHDRMSLPGLFLPITTPMGLALLGLAEGQHFAMGASGGPRRVLLERVLFQPEAARRERETRALLDTPAMRRSALKVVAGTACGVPLEIGGAPAHPAQGPE